MYRRRREESEAKSNAEGGEYTEILTSHSRVHHRPLEASPRVSRAGEEVLDCSEREGQL